MSESEKETPVEIEQIEEKIEETEEKIEEVKSDPEYATKADITTLTEALAAYREELKEAKKSKPVVPAPEKKAEPKKEESKKEEPKVEEEPKVKSYGSKRWFGDR